MVARLALTAVVALQVAAFVAFAACSSSNGPPGSGGGTPDGGAPDGSTNDGSQGNDAGVGSTCGKLLLCDQACNGTPCTDACYAGATGVAQGLFNALTSCIDENCPSTDGGACASPSSSACSACNTQAATGTCVSRLESCESDAKVGPPDPDGGGVVVVSTDAGAQLNCGQYTACVAACPPLDGGSCTSTCASQATSEATALASALGSCLATSCPSADGGPCAMPGTGCNGCVEQSEFGGGCQTPYQACENDTSTSPDAGTTPVVLADGGTLKTVLSGLDQIGSAMLVQDGYLYFAQDNASGQVSRIWIADGGAVDAAATPLGPPQPSPVGLAATSSDVYVWSYGSFSASSSVNNDDGTVVKIPLDGGAPLTVAQNVEVYYAAPYLNGMATDGQNLYWVSGAKGNNGAIVKTPIGSTTATPIYTQQYLPEAVVTDGTNVYWANWGTFDAQGYSNSDGTIQQGSVDGGATITLASNLSAPAALAIDAQNVYWTNLGKLGGDNLPALNTGSVMQVPIGGGTVITLSAQEDVPIGIAVDGQNVYWTEYGLGSPGLVLRVPKGGGSVVPLVANLKNPYSLVVSANALYFSFYAAATPSSTSPLIDSLSPF